MMRDASHCGTSRERARHQGLRYHSGRQSSAITRSASASVMPVSRRVQTRRSTEMCAPAVTLSSSSSSTANCSDRSHCHVPPHSQSSHRLHSCPRQPPTGVSAITRPSKPCSLNCPINARLSAGLVRQLVESTISASAVSTARLRAAMHGDRNSPAHTRVT